MMSPPNRKPVSKSPNQKAVNTSHPSLDPSEILHRQKEALKNTIQKAEMEENKRVLRINQQTTKFDKQNLEMKFENERQAEKERINNLIFDFQVLKEKINTGEYSHISIYLYLSISIYIYIYICPHVYIHTYIYLCMYINIHIYIHVYTYIYIYVYTYTYKFVYICICIDIYKYI
jgi:hypothetical protein